jgi:lipid II:glycine glycyltransferase (peptidoglycan interpeptide bridge formation enzyme)
MWLALRRRLAGSGGVVLRVDPPWSSEEGSRTLTSSGAKPALPIQHQATALIELRGPEEVLAGMSQLARRNMRKAERAGVTVGVSDSTEALDQLYPILAETGERKSFPVRPKSYYLDLLDIFRRFGQACVYVAYYKGVPVAASLMMSYGKRLIYLLGGSTDEGRSLRAAYLLQDRAIRDAHARGLTVYDLWGIPLTADPNHPGQGYARFKEMLGGKPVRFIGSFDLPVNRPLSLAFKLAERFTNRRGNLTVEPGV